MRPCRQRLISHALRVATNRVGLVKRAVNKALRPWVRWQGRRDGASAARVLAGLRLQDPVVVVLVSGGLQIAALALGRVPATIPVILVLNGLDRWEVAWVRRNLVCAAAVEFRTIRRHGEVIDLLIDHLQGNFGILDYDCFVLNPAWWGRMTALGPTTAMQGCFPFRAAAGNLALPHTFFLYFHRAVVKGLKEKFGVGAGDLPWERIPAAVQERLATLGYGPGVVPEPDRDFFDTLRILMLLAETEGVPCRLVGDLPGDPIPNDEVFHVGGVSLRHVVFNLWLYRGAYFWRRSLQRFGDPGLAEHYRRRFGEIDPESLARQYPEFAAQVDPALLKYFDDLIDLARGKG